MRLLWLRSTVVNMEEDVNTGIALVKPLLLMFLVYREIVSNKSLEFEEIK